MSNSRRTIGRVTAMEQLAAKAAVGQPLDALERECLGITDTVNVITPRMTQVVQFRDGYAVVFDGRLATARWSERGPAEAQMSLLKKGYSTILPDGTIQHTPPRAVDDVPTAMRILKNYATVNSPAEALDLWDVLSWPTISKENYCGSSYWEWEDKVCRPALEAAGYVNVTFHMGERDGFGPLSRIVRAQKDGQKVEFIYG